VFRAGQVFKVWVASTNAVEAVSIMDVRALAHNLGVVVQEVRLACLASELVASHVCRNFVQLFQVRAGVRSGSVCAPVWVW
jgi:hypothetical protein